MNLRMVAAALALGALVTSAEAKGRIHGAGPVNCEVARCTVLAQIIAVCPCNAATTHGAYVKCVAQELKQLSRAGTLPRHCKGKGVECAARSVCGRPGAVLCTAASGTCHVASSDQACTAGSGTVGPGESCCGECPGSPRGAMLGF